MQLSSQVHPQRFWAPFTQVSGIAGMLTGLLLLTAPIQPGLLKHDAYRSVALICFTALMACHYLRRAKPIAVSQRYALSAGLFSLWGLLTAAWSSTGDQALLFALLPPIFFLALPILALSWRRHPWASALSLAVVACCLFGLETLHILGSWVSGDTPYRMPNWNWIRPYLFYNSRDANQFHILLLWSGLPCLVAGLRYTHKRLQPLLFGAGLLIPALGLFLILASQGDGALVALLAGSLTSWIVLRRDHARALAWFALALGLGAVLFLILNLTLGQGDLFGDLVSRNANEFDPSRGRLRSWLAHGTSMLNNQLWLGAGYRAIPTGSGLCAPHNIVVSLAYSLGLPGLGLAALWVSSMRWSQRNAAIPLQALAPGVFTALLVYQLVDEIWGFAPSLVLLSILLAMACPIESGVVATPTSVWPFQRGMALLGLALIATFFVAARMEPWINGQPARQSCMMGFINPHLQKQVPRGIVRYQLAPDDSTSFRPIRR